MMRIIAAFIGGVLGAGFGFGLGIVAAFAYAMLNSSGLYSWTLIYIFDWTLPIGILVGLVIGVRCGTLVYDRIE